MRLLLDTHLWLWFNLKPERLPAAWTAALAEPDCEFMVSVASVWELSIKHKLGKLEVSGPFLPFVDGALADIEVLDIRLSHIQRGHDLPLIHRDPFDRMIIAQALAEGLTLLTVDAVMSKYGVTILPAT